MGRGAWGQELGVGSWKLEAGSWGEDFGGSPKPTGQWPVLLNDLRVENWRSATPQVQ